MSFFVGHRRVYFSYLARLGPVVALALALTGCGDDKPPECTKPADCVGRPLADTCKVVKGHGRCVLSCATANGMDNCPATYHCTGTADDGSFFCASP